MKLSIFLAGIRPQNWVALYNSIPNVTSLSRKQYELVIVSPYDLPPEFSRTKNIRLIKDKGCPTRCYQLGLFHSRGEYVVWAADDGVFSPTLAIDKAFAALPSGDKGIVSLRYIEGGLKAMSKMSWWNIGYHKRLSHALYAPNEYLLIMLGLMRRDYLTSIGGWDCVLQHVGLSCVDLSIRLQNNGARVVMGEKLMDISLCKGRSGDHGPVHLAHKSDKVLFSQIYNDPDSVKRDKIVFENWKNAPSIWGSRFPQE